MSFDRFYDKYWSVLEPIWLELTSKENVILYFILFKKVWNLFGFKTQFFKENGFNSMIEVFFDNFEPEMFERVAYFRNVIKSMLDYYVRLFFQFRLISFLI
jgi:hypothetical protein